MIHPIHPIHGAVRQRVDGMDGGSRGRIQALANRSTRDPRQRWRTARPATAPALATGEPLDPRPRPSTPDQSTALDDGIQLAPIVGDGGSLQPDSGR